MHIPGPDTRVVELRVHGILGTTGEDLTDAVASVDVAGDGIGRIVQPADSLRRPVTGTPLSAGDRTVPRVVEGYVWGAMTSGGLAKATWALLFPFALANMAHWMLPPTNQNNRASRALSSTLRALLRVAALLLTMLFIAQLTVLSLDLLASRCLGPNTGCLDVVPNSLRTDMIRAAIGLLPLCLVVLLMHRLSTVSWRVSTGSKHGGQESARAPVMPGANVVSDPDTPALRALHAVAALSITVLLALGGPFAMSTDPRWVTAAALLGIALIGTVMLDDPTGLRVKPASIVLRATLGPIPRRVLVSLATLLLIGVVLVGPPTDSQQLGSAATVSTLTTALLIICVVVGLLLIPATLLARASLTKEAAKQSSQLGPWARGWIAAPVLLIACLLGNGFGAGLGISLGQLLELQPPTVYAEAATSWGITTVLTVLAAVLSIPFILISRWRTNHDENGVPAEIELLHAGRQHDQRSAAEAWRWAELQRRHSYRALIVLASVLGVSTALTLLAPFGHVPLTTWFPWLVSVGVATLAMLAGGLLRMVYLAAKKPKAAKFIGILCDLTLFWPREAHPVVPPCYALKVIPELAARAAHHLADPNTRVVMVGHSQGSLLAAVATARLLESLPEADRERVGLITAGSQLQWAYPRAFPAVVSHDSLRNLTGSLHGRWRSLCRGTDPIGGAVSTWNRQVFGGMLLGVGFRADGTEGPLSPATRGPTGALVLGGDHWLPDPQRGPFKSRRWLPGVLAHSEYSSDPEWDRAVAMAAGLETPVRSASLPLRTPAAAGIGSTAPAEAPALQAHGSDGVELPDPDVEWDTELSSVLVEAQHNPVAESGAKTNGHAVERWNEAESRALPSELPELTEPRGRTAPWERGTALRRSEH